METIGFVLGCAGVVFGLAACARVESLKQEVAELKQSLGRSDAPRPDDPKQTTN